MEKITINEVEEKQTAAGKKMFKVTYNDNLTFNLFDNNEQEAWYFKQNIGQVVDVSFTMSKCGKYKNLADVLMTNPSHEAREGVSTQDKQIKPEVQGNLMSVRDIQIIAQCMVKCVAYNKPMNIKEAIDLFHQSIKILENNG